MNKQEIHDQTFLNIACEIANLSNCVSYEVGCVIVKDGRIITQGYNGSPSGFINCCEIFGPDFDREEHHRWSDNFEIHAEMNAILFAAKHGIMIEGTTIYCSVQPCHPCLKHLIGVGVKRVVYATPYDKANYTDETYEMIKKGNLEIEHFKSYEERV